VALVRIRRQIEATGQRKGYFDLATKVTQDRDRTCRWQATIVIGEFIEADPERVWRVAKTLATSPNADIRMAAATVLLEHLLEFHTAEMVPRFRAALRSGDRRFASAVSFCSNFGNARTRAGIPRIIDEAKAV
jgi:hypothetical protein